MAQHQLVDDIYNVLNNGYDLSDEDAIEFGKEIAGIIQSRLKERMEPEREFTLRMSNIGKGARQLWYDKQHGRGEVLPPSTILKFIYGDLIESLVLLLARVSGHSVLHRQAEVAVAGVKGHIDADIDGTTVDVKSASSHAFKKFSTGSLLEDDAFGYIEQLASYCNARDTDGAFLAVDKQNGFVTYMPLSKEDLKAAVDVEARVAYLKDAMESDTPPERCYSDEPFGTSGNRKLSVNCSYCSHKKRCWADTNNGIGLRTFQYSTGPVFLTQVAKEPNVRETTF